MLREKRKAKEQNDVTSETCNGERVPVSGESSAEAWLLHRVSPFLSFFFFSFQAPSGTSLLCSVDRPLVSVSLHQRQDAKCKMDFDVNCTSAERILF